MKQTNGTDNNAPPGPLVPVGSTVTFTYVLTNPGNVALSGPVTVTDDNGTPGVPADDFNAVFFSGDDVSANGMIDTDETWVYTASRVATLGLYSNIGTASATYMDQPITDTDPDNHTGVVVTITPTGTATRTPTSTNTATSTPIFSNTATSTPTSTNTATRTPTSTRTATRTPTFTPTGTVFNGVPTSTLTFAVPAIPALTGRGTAVFVLLLLAVSVAFLFRTRR